MKDYKSLAASFNTARINMQTEVLSGKEMYHTLTKVIGFGKDSNLLNLLTKKNIIRRISKNQYMFPETPVYYGKIQTILQLRNREKYKKSKEISLQKAIDICHANGFVVSKVVAKA